MKQKSPFAKKLETIRKAEKLSLVLAAKKAGISQYTWLSLEHDRSAIPKIVTLVKICKAFHLTVDELIQDTQFE